MRHSDRNGWPKIDKGATHYESTRRHPRAPEVCYCVPKGPYGEPRYVGRARIDGALCDAWRGWTSDFGGPKRPRYFFQLARTGV